MSLSFWNRLGQAPLPPPIDVDMTGKSVIITGANVGLGLESAKHFARMAHPPARLVLACRSQSKGDAAAAEIERETGYAYTEVRLVDLDSFASVDAFATAYDTPDARLDVLVCNAGMLVLDYHLSTDGWESTLQVNDLSTLLLALLLLPCLLRSARDHGVESRMIIVSSGVHKRVPNLDAVMDAPNILAKLSQEEYCKGSGVMRQRYGVSKLINVFHTRALNSRISPTTPLVVSSLAPGFCRSQLSRNAPWWIWPLFALYTAIRARTTEEGARVIVYAAAGGDGAAQRGKYIVDCAVGEESAFVNSEKGEEFERRIWNESIEVLEKAVPRVRQIIEQHLSGP